MSEKDKLDIKVNMVKSEKTKVRAYVSVVFEFPGVGKFALNSIRVVEGSKGTFVSMPAQEKERDGKTQYYDYFHPITKEGREAVSEIIIQAYEKELAKS